MAEPPAWHDLSSLTGKALAQAIATIARLGYREPATVAAVLPEVMSLLNHPEADIRARSCWALGQVGFRQPAWVAEALPSLAVLLADDAPRVRAQALWALGRLGRAEPALVEALLPQLLACTTDPDPQVRMNVIWASENIATMRPEWFAPYLPVFLALLADPDTRYVRPEAPEIFRVIGKRRPDLVQAIIPALTASQSDECYVTRIHAQGALNAIQKARVSRVSHI